jgi:hypothetical protein
MSTMPRETGYEEAHAGHPASSAVSFNVPEQAGQRSN